MRTAASTLSFADFLLGRATPADAVLLPAAYRDHPAFDHAAEMFDERGGLLFAALALILSKQAQKKVM